MYFDFLKCLAPKDITDTFRVKAEIKKWRQKNQPMEKRSPPPSVAKAENANVDEKDRGVKEGGCSKIKAEDATKDDLQLTFTIKDIRDRKPVLLEQIKVRRV